jgi:hypothetical protein
VPHLRDGFIVDKVGHRAKARSVFIKNPQKSVTNPEPEGTLSGVPKKAAAKRPPLYPRPPDGRLFAMPQAPSDLLNEKLASVATDIEAIEELIASEPLQTTDQLLALRTVQELYRRLADDLRVAISLFE